VQLGLNRALCKRKLASTTPTLTENIIATNSLNDDIVLLVAHKEQKKVDLGDASYRMLLSKERNKAFSFHFEIKKF
jgi:hypothetical protein